jgi:L-gulonate 5-dehydrogenase
VGHVESVGSGVSSDRVGQRVAVDPVIACGSCYPCSVGRPNVCRRLQVVGVHRDGGFSELLCAPAANAHVVPSGIADAAAATIEPFAVAANVTSRPGVFPNDVALVYGAGPIGLMVLQVLKGVHGIRVLVTDRIDERLGRATACGADAVINTAREPLPEALRRLGVEDGPTLVMTRSATRPSWKKRCASRLPRAASGCWDSRLYPRRFPSKSRRARSSRSLPRFSTAACSPESSSG